MRLLLLVLLFTYVFATQPYVLDLGGSTWTVTNSSTSPVYEAEVPGVIHTDLLNAGAIPDPYYRYNDVDYRWVGLSTWTYSLDFDVVSKVLDYNTVCFHVSCFRWN